MSHAKISAAQRAYRNSLDKLPGGRWGSTTTADELRIGYNMMSDAGVSKKDAFRAIKKSYKYFKGLGAL